jgi:lipoyl-dependent peroxiredoxin
MKLRIRRRAEVGWRGTVAEGSGRVALGSGEFTGADSLKSRVDEEATANPEELIVAGHPACFTMSVADLLSERGTPALIS